MDVKTLIDVNRSIQRGFGSLHLRDGPYEPSYAVIPFVFVKKVTTSPFLQMTIKGHVWAGFHCAPEVR